MKRLSVLGLLALPAIAAFAQAPLSDALRTSGADVLEALKNQDLPPIEARFSDRMRTQLAHDKFVATGKQTRHRSAPSRPVASRSRSVVTTLRSSAIAASSRSRR